MHRIDNARGIPPWHITMFNNVIIVRVCKHSCPQAQNDAFVKNGRDFDGVWIRLMKLVIQFETIQFVVMQTLIFLGVGEVSKSCNDLTDMCRWCENVTSKLTIDTLLPIRTSQTIFVKVIVRLQMTFTELQC